MEIITDLPHKRGLDSQPLTSASSGTLTSSTRGTLSTDLKTCTQCSSTKPASEFYKFTRKNTDKTISRRICKTCYCLGLARKAKLKGAMLMEGKQNKGTPAAVDLSEAKAHTVPMELDNYTAKNIRVLTPEEAGSRIGWLLPETLAAEYCKPIEWVKRSLEACRRAGKPHQYFIDRYLLKKPVAFDSLVDQAARDLALELAHG